MGKPRRHPPVKLICGMISAHEELFEKASRLLQERFGEIDLKSEVMPFDHTDYYAKEMGEGLKRLFVSFSRLIPPESLAEIKLFTNGIESMFLKPGTENRMINLDPGYVAPNKLVLATTKDYAHRIYLGKGIFAEVTLKFYNGSFRPWEWTYPDYRTEGYIEFFNRVRRIYLDQLRSMGISPHPSQWEVIDEELPSDEPGGV